jgi:hypothetical protein
MQIVSLRRGVRALRSQVRLDSERSVPAVIDAAADFVAFLRGEPLPQTPLPAEGLAAEELDVPF